MQIEVYADMVFLINFIMIYFIYWIVMKITGRKISKLRICAAAFIAALLYCIMIFVGVFRQVYNIFGAISIIMISVVICFRPRSVKEFFKLIFLSVISAFAVGGISIGLFYFTDIQNLIGNMTGIAINNFSFKILLSATCISYITIKYALYWYRKIVLKKQQFLKVIIYYKNEKTKVNALVDTGNSLHEPITNNPVIVTEFNALRNILPESIRLIFYENRENDLQSVMKLMAKERVKIIPFSSLGKQNGMLIGFKPDKIKILGENETEIYNAVVGIYNFKLSKDGVYNALLSPDIFEGKMEGLN